MSRLQFDDIVLQSVDQLQKVIPQGPPKVAIIAPMQNPAKDIEAFFNSSEQSKIMVTYSGNSTEGYKHVEAYQTTLGNVTQEWAHTIEVHLCCKVYMKSGTDNIPSDNPGNTMLRLMYLVPMALVGLKMYERDWGTSGTATIDINTPAANGDVLLSLSILGKELLNGSLNLVDDATIATEIQIATAINNFSYLSGYYATSNNGTVTVYNPSLTGGNINGNSITVGTITGTLVLGTPSVFAGGINGTGKTIMDDVHQASNGGMFLIESFVDKNYPGVVCVCRFQVMEIVTQMDMTNPADIWGVYRDIILQEYSGSIGIPIDNTGSPDDVAEIT